MFTKKTVPKRSCLQQKLSSIGSGSYSTVYKIEDNDNLVLKQYGEDSWMDFKTEMHVLYQLRDTSIIDCFDYGLCPDEKYAWSVLPKLYRNLQEKPPCQNNLRSVALQLLVQIKILHNLDIIHQDIKPSNIMWIDSKMTSIQLIDFGSSRNMFYYTKKGVRRKKQKRNDVFCSTTHFVASDNALRSNEQSYGDNIETMCWCIHFFIHSTKYLPSRCHESCAEMLIYRRLPKNTILRTLIEYARKLQYGEKPEYDYCRRLLEQI